MEKEQLRHLVTGLVPYELRILRSIINGKLGKRVITREQSSYMLEVKRLKQEIRVNAAERKHDLTKFRVMRPGEPADILCAASCRNCQGSILIMRNLEVNHILYNEPLTEGPDCRYQKGEYYHDFKR